MTSLGCRTSNLKLFFRWPRLELDIDAYHSNAPAIARDLGRDAAVRGYPSLCPFFMPPPSLFEPGTVG